MCAAGFDKGRRAAIMRAAGEMPEWPNGTDSKSVEQATVPRVQIPISPPYISSKPLKFLEFRGLFRSGLAKCRRTVENHAPGQRSTHPAGAPAQGAHNAWSWSATYGREFSARSGYCLRSSRTDWRTCDARYEMTDR